MLGADVPVPEIVRLVGCKLEHALRPLGERDLSRRLAAALPEERAHLRARSVERDAELSEHARRDSLPLAQEPE